jgi:polyferredoxin
MGRLRGLIGRRLVLLRVLSQAFFALLFVYVLWSTTYPLTGAVSPNVLFTVDPLLMVVTSLSERVLVPGLAIGLAMLAATFVLGRFFCGWICPLGLSIDLAAWLGGTKGQAGPAFPRARHLKFWLLGVIAVFAAFGVQLAWPFDPIVIVGRFVSLNLIPGVVKSADAIFITLIRTFGNYTPLYDFYRSLKEGVLGVNVRFFSHTLVILGVFAAVVAAGAYYRRFWCRVACPLGALYAATARFALLKRVTRGCTGCGRCAGTCRTAAIRDDGTYDAGECVMCMDCVYDCTADGTSFSFRRPPPVAGGEPVTAGLTRGEFLSLALAAVPMAASASGLPVAGKTAGPPLRPPGALPEAEFVDRCVRCGNCMKVCLTNGLVPSVLEAGAQGIWTPRLVPSIGYCEYNCTLCGQVCPVHAIAPLPVEVKRKFRIGEARVNMELCLPWSQGKECLVCEEHCPIPEKAIKRVRVPRKGVTVYGPRVEPEICVGCGICENKCPLRPERAIKVGQSERGPEFS